MTATPLSTAAEVLLATDHDPFARATLRRPLVRGWARGRTVVWVGTDPEERRHYLSALGDPGAVAGLVGELVPELPPRQRVTLPRGTGARLPAWVAVDGVDWDFRWLTAPPPCQPGEDRVVVVDDQAVAALLAVTSPTASAQPGDTQVRSWLGVPGDDGALLSGSDSIRDVIAFPKTASGSDLLTGAPSAVDNAQLTELGLRLR